jgi:acyl-CoA oxidase
MSTQESRNALLRILFDGQYEEVHADIRNLLRDPIFDARAELTLSDAGRLAYDRSRFVHSRLERPLQFVKNPARLFALAEWPALMDVSVFSLLMVHYNLCFGTLVDHGSGRADLADQIEELDSLRSFGPYMATELGFGNNVAAMRTEARYEPAREVFILNTPDALAQKHMSYSGFSDIPKIAVVMARLKAGGKDWGVFPFLVRIADDYGLCPGISAVPCPEKPVQGLDNGLTTFCDVVVPRRDLLLGDMAEFTPQGEFRANIGNPRKRFLRAMSRIQPGRLCVASAAMGAGRASVYIALRFAQHRLTNAPGRNDMPVIAYRSHQLPTFTALAKVFALTLLLNHVKRAFIATQPEIGSELNHLISITKAMCTWEMTDVITVCRERCGAQGIFSANRIADYVSLLQGLVTAEGDNLVLLGTAAGQMLAQPASEPLLAPAHVTAHDLTDIAWQLELLQYRESWLLDATRKTNVQTQDQSYFESLNATVHPGLAMARLHGVRVALQCMSEAIDSVEQEDVKQALRTLAALYGLTEIKRDSGWYSALGLASAEQILSLDALADRLCAEISPHVPMLIDGFALSPELLRAPIAHADYIAEFCQQAERQARHRVGDSITAERKRATLGRGLIVAAYEE